MNELAEYSKVIIRTRPMYKSIERYGIDLNGIKKTPFKAYYYLKAIEKLKVTSSNTEENYETYKPFRIFTTKILLLFNYRVSCGMVNAKVKDIEVKDGYYCILGFIFPFELFREIEKILYYRNVKNIENKKILLTPKKYFGIYRPMYAKKIGTTPVNCRYSFLIFLILFYSADIAMAVYRMIVREVDRCIPVEKENKAEYNRILLHLLRERMDISKKHYLDGFL